MQGLDPARVGLYIRLAALAVFLIVVVIILVRSRRAGSASSSGGEASDASPPVREIEDLVAMTSAHNLASLTVLESDDKSLVEHVFYILKYPVTLGRNPGNDFTFPNDSPVSNFHARLALSGDKVLLSEMELAVKGSVKRPRYGTFVNGVPLRAEPVELQDGDEIQLGPRLRLRYDWMDISRLPGTFDEKRSRQS